MISILIPTYNFNTLPLVEELHKQAVLENIDFEIIVVDDASPINEVTEINSKINLLSQCRFERNETNLGRGQNRNLLISKAQYDWVLLMDCDMYPKSKNFLKIYLKSLAKSNNKVVFGGLIYFDEKPKDDEVLRWIFGKNREEIPLKKRLSNPYHYTLISNILVRKEVLLSHPFDRDIYHYGYEDIVLILGLKNHHIPITHIENPAFHLNLEKSAVFLEKFHYSLQNLKQIIDKKIIHPEDTTLTKTYVKIEQLKLVGFATFLFKIFKKLFIKNLLSKNPSIFLFDLYRLGYFCQLNHR
ncbi:glycosyltransferase family 2 protein [Flavobacterium sp. IMCC34852]|uniref:Glycosyltransferase family 2 protein n=1 Tax=Flavobacterium rivulicola TaxID=2732161 RepID=A0A7Y3RA91_9FLAO|nr:glycosyltransferase family 2 protein [Flavobacterium sp. IMCC34852]NNT72785.1 glycosyltransferase family 2 protein [Flavobacterium sp. IMCC34852]